MGFDGIKISFHWRDFMGILFSWIIYTYMKNDFRITMLRAVWEEQEIHWFHHGMFGLNIPHLFY